jgi:diketogulonate reductase-like aldo/keto reductase
MTASKGPTYTLNNGVKMPAFGLGVFKSKPEETVTAVMSAIAAGYGLIDTASVYKNEEQVGQGVRESGVAREDIFLTTKLWMSDYGFDQTLRAFDQSLGRLGIDVLDLYMIHWPTPSAFEATLESYKAAIKLLTDGRVRAIGVSNFGARDLDILIARTGHVPAVNQVELHPFFNQADLRKVHHELGVITQAWSPIGGVNRYGAKASTSTAGGGSAPVDLLSHPTVALLAGKYAKTPAQIILRWHIELGDSPIPKSVRPQRIAENIAIFDFTLTPDEVQAIDALHTGERGGWDPDQVTAQTFA